MKWHQAHTTWFFETFVLRPFLPDYKPFCEDFRRLFNSYYNSLGDPIPDKPSRSFLSRPSRFWVTTEGMLYSQGGPKLPNCEWERDSPF
jgi:hypothetical protein